MATGLEHIVLYELVNVPSRTVEELKESTLPQPFHYVGNYCDLKTLVDTGMFIY